MVNVSTFKNNKCESVWMLHAIEDHVQQYALSPQPAEMDRVCQLTNCHKACLQGSGFVVLYKYRQKTTMKNYLFTYKDQEFDVRPQDYQGNTQYWVYQNDVCVAIAYEQEMVPVLIQEKVDYPNWTAKASSRFD